MSTPAATETTVAAAPAAASAPNLPAKTVAADIRKRILSGAPPAPPKTETPPEDAAKAKEAADKKAADDAAKAKADADAAEAAKKKEETEPRAKKVKAGPPLPEPERKAVDTRTVEQVVRDVLPEITKQAAAAPKLAPDIEREIELAKFAAQSEPDKYSGFDEKVATFFSAHDQLRAAKATELGGANSAEFKDYLESEEYKAWLKENRPAYRRGDRDRFQEGMVAVRAKEQARQAIEPEIKELKRKTAELEYGPVIRQRVGEVSKILLTDNDAEKDPALAGFVKDPVAFSQAHPDEAKAIAEVANDFVQRIEEVYRVGHELVDVDPVKRPQQKWIREFMSKTNADMRAKYPNGIETQDGKILVDAETYMDRGLARDARYRTLNADEMASMIAITGQVEVKRRLKERREGVARSVYIKKDEAAKPTAQIQEEPASPAAVVSRASGTASKSAQPPSIARKYV